MRLSNLHIKLGKLSIVVLALLFIGGQAWGGTFYVKKIGAQLKYLENAWPTAGTGTNATDLENAATSIGAGHTIVIAVGTYVAADLSATSWTVNRSQTIRSAIVSDPEYTTNGGDVVLNGAGLSYTIEVGAANVVFSGLTIKGVEGTGYNFYAWAGPITLNDCIIEDGGRAVRTHPDAITVTFNRCTFRNNANADRTMELGDSSITNFNYCFFYNNAADVYLADSTGNFNNCVFAGNWGNYGTLRAGVAGSAGNVNNCIFTANSSMLGAYDIVVIEGGAITISNSILQLYPTDPTKGYQTFTDGGGNTYLSPKLTQPYGGRGYVAIGTEEDYQNKSANNSFAYIADYALSKGVRAYVGIGQVQWYSAQDWVELTAYATQGHELCNHSKYHLNGPTQLDPGVFTIDGPADGTVSIAINEVSATDSSTWTGTLLLKEGGSTVKTIDISFSEIATTGSWLGLKTSINAQDGWTASYAAGDAYPCILFADKTDQAVASATTFPLDIDRYLFVEYVEAQKIIKDNTGYEPRVIIYPQGSYTADIYNWLKNQDNWTPLGLTAPLGGRAAALAGQSYTRVGTDYTSGPGTKAGCQIWAVSAPQLTSAIGTSNIARDTDAMLDWLGHIGGQLIFYTHGTDEYSVENIHTFIDAIASNSSVQVMTPGAMLARIRSEAVDADSDGLRWVAVEADNANYRPLIGSPTIGAGVLITGLHDQATPATDLAGTPVTWGPSIGAYQPTPANVVYFDKSAAAGGNGMQSTPYNDMASYPVAKLISGTAANPLYIYLKGDFSAEALDFSAYGGPADPYVVIRTPRLNQAANLGALTVKGSNMTQQYYMPVQAIPSKVWSDFTQYTTVP